MSVLIAMGAFCRVDDLAEVLVASGIAVVAPEHAIEAAQNDTPAVAILEDDDERLPHLLESMPSTRAVMLHASQREALALALSDGIEPAAAFERWRTSTLSQVALFRRMRARTVLVSRQRFELAPAELLGLECADVAVVPWQADPLALLLADWIIARRPSPDPAVSMLAACMREQDRGEIAVDMQDALVAWRRCTALAADVQAAVQAREMAETRAHESEAALAAADQALAAMAHREKGLTDENGLLREQVIQMQAALETAWRQHEDSRRDAEAARGAQAALTRDMSTMRDTMTAQEGALKEAEAGCATAVAELAKARETLTAREAAFRVAQARQIDSDAELAKARATLATRDKALAEREAALKAAQGRIAALETSLEAARHAVPAQETRLLEAESRSTAPAGAVAAELEKLRKVEASQAEEIGLLRDHIVQLQSAFETAWLQKDEVRATASRRPPVHAGLTVTVDLDTAASARP